eukprot:TRINITY_DN29912_c0_g1_i1.p1 TRINITY_DN29912_c0_g1~~TRINITY_DN29912_c0_g1_i1.p1  ORF type:complete len:204 (-),score=29.54 TRINITY_DN29912_c0_g1_i1:175-786(-)
MAGQTQRSYVPNYYSIQDILATQERVPCISNAGLPGLGFLDPGSDEPDLPSQAKLELPFWMIEGMRQGQKYFNMQLPKAYKETYREILSADANVVDLHKLGPHYYEYGGYLMKHVINESDLVGAALSNAFKSRFLNLMDAAQNCQDGEELKEMQKMDEIERALFRKAYTNRKGMADWMSRKVYQIRTSTMVTNYKKRKAAHIS